MCSGMVLPTNGDDIAQENEIGPSNNLKFGLAEMGATEIALGNRTTKVCEPLRQAIDPLDRRKGRRNRRLRVPG